MFSLFNKDNDGQLPIFEDANLQALVNELIAIDEKPRPPTAFRRDLGKEEEVRNAFASIQSSTDLLGIIHAKQSELNTKLAHIHEIDKQQDEVIQESEKMIESVKQEYTQALISNSADTGLVEAKLQEYTGNIHTAKIQKEGLSQAEKVLSKSLKYVDRVERHVDIELRREELAVLKAAYTDELDKFAETFKKYRSDIRITRYQGWGDNKNTMRRDILQKLDLFL